MDDRVDMHYVLERLEGIIKGFGPNTLIELYRFQDELVYNLGINQMNRVREPRADVKCPECDGDGYIEFDVPRPHNVGRDVGVIDIEMEICKKCNGDGMVEDDDD